MLQMVRQSHVRTSVRSRSGRLLAVVLVSVVLGASAIAQSPKPDGNPAGVSNFGRVTETFLRGGEVTADGLKNLHSIGVRTIVDLRDDPEPEEAEVCRQLGLTYYSFPLTGHEAPDPATMQKVLDLITKADAPIYVHCSGGKHRAGTACAMYRMRVDGWTPERAWSEQQAYGFGPPEEHAEMFLSLYAGTPVAKRLGREAAVLSSRMVYPDVARMKSAPETTVPTMSWSGRLSEPSLAIRRARAAGATGDVIRVDIEYDSEASKPLWKIIFSSGLEYRFDAVSGVALGSKPKDADSVATLSPLRISPSFSGFRRVALAAERVAGVSATEIELKRIKGRKRAFYEVALADGTTFYVDALSGRQIVEF